MLTCDLSTLPVVSMMGRVEEQTGWSHPGRSMRTNLLVIFHGGSCIFELNGRSISCAAGDVMLVPQGTPYKPHTDSTSEYTFFHFDGQLLPCVQPPEAAQALAPMLYGEMDKSDLYLLLPEHMRLDRHDTELELLLSRCVHIQQQTGAQRQLLLSLVFAELLYHISQTYRSQTRRTQSFPASVQKIVQYAQENYTKPITLADIQAHTGVSKQYIMRVFKARVGMTVTDYLLDLRMRHAAYLLHHTYMNVNQAADYLGFSSVSYFSRVFKKYYGVPPSEYAP